MLWSKKFHEHSGEGSPSCTSKTFISGYKPSGKDFEPSEAKSGKTFISGYKPSDEELADE